MAPKKKKSGGRGGGHSGSKNSASQQSATSAPQVDGTPPAEAELLASNYGNASKSSPAAPDSGASSSSSHRPSRTTAFTARRSARQNSSRQPYPRGPTRRTTSSTSGVASQASQGRVGNRASASRTNRASRSHQEATSLFLSEAGYLEATSGISAALSDQSGELQSQQRDATRAQPPPDGHSLLIKVFDLETARIMLFAVNLLLGPFSGLAESMGELEARNMEDRDMTEIVSTLAEHTKWLQGTYKAYKTNITRIIGAGLSIENWHHPPPRPASRIPSSSPTSESNLGPGGAHSKTRRRLIDEETPCQILEAISAGICWLSVASTTMQEVDKEIRNPTIGGWTTELAQNTRTIMSMWMKAEVLVLRHGMGVEETRLSFGFSPASSPEPHPVDSLHSISFRGLLPGSSRVSSSTARSKLHYFSTIHPADPAAIIRDPFSWETIKSQEAPTYGDSVVVLRDLPREKLKPITAWPHDNVYRARTASSSSAADGEGSSCELMDEANSAPLMIAANLGAFQAKEVAAEMEKLAANIEDMTVRNSVTDVMKLASSLEDNYRAAMDMAIERTGRPGPTRQRYQVTSLTRSVMPARPERTTDLDILSRLMCISFRFVQLESVATELQRFATSMEDLELRDKVIGLVIETTILGQMYRDIAVAGITLRVIRACNDERGDEGSSITTTEAGPATEPQHREDFLPSSSPTDGENIRGVAEEMADRRRENTYVQAIVDEMGEGGRNGSCAADGSPSPGGEDQFDGDEYTEVV